MASLEKELLFAKKIATQAGNLLLTYFKNDLKIEYKTDNSPCTEADLASNHLIVNSLKQIFPEDSILSEELGRTSEEKSFRTWTIDPLDGTLDFINGLNGFSVLVALLEDKTPILAVVYLPTEKKLYYAVKGQGAFIEFQDKTLPLTVSLIKQFSSATCVLPENNKDEIIAHLASKAQRKIFRGGFGSRIMTLVDGTADFCISRGKVKIWDVAAPQLILEEAGGKITYLEGSKINYSFEDPIIGKILATNTHLHSQLLTLLEPTL